MYLLKKPQHDSKWFCYIQLSLALVKKHAVHQGAVIAQLFQFRANPTKLQTENRGSMTKLKDCPCWYTQTSEKMYNIAIIIDLKCQLLILFCL